LGLLARAVDGDPSALRHLLDEVAPLMVRAARRILGRRHAEVEDVAQQALAAFVERLPTFRNESSVAHFAQRIAIYRALSARRAAAIRRRVSADAASELADQAGAPFEPPDAGVVERTRRALLVDALAALPAPQAEALALHFLFDHTVAEIAEMTSSPEETVRSRLRLGKRALRERIEREPDLACLRELWS
jgi:RNA polymerase sigma-70 factor (ECF subfamily)